MALVTPTIDTDKQALLQQYQTARTRLDAIQTEMQGSPSPAQAYAAVDDMAAIVDRMLVVIRNAIS